jgi:hypothetical protein
VLSSICFGYSGGSGTSEDPYQIATKADLLALAAIPTDYNKCFILTADIDLDPNLPGGQVFTTAIIAADTDPANDSFQGTAFTGTFDDNGHKIAHFTINGGSNEFLGLFGYISSGGKVKNLGIEDFEPLLVGKGKKENSMRRETHLLRAIHINSHPCAQGAP